MEDEPHNPEFDEDIKQFQMRRKWETRSKACCKILCMCDQNIYFATTIFFTCIIIECIKTNLIEIFYWIKRVTNNETSNFHIKKGFLSSLNIYLKTCKIYYTNTLNSFRITVNFFKSK